MNQNVDVIIIGGGLSGLRSADLLKSAGKSVIVLEAHDRVGGLTQSTFSARADSMVDYGGQWISAEHNRMNALCERFSVPLKRYHTAGAAVHVTDGVGVRGTDDPMAGLSDADAEAMQAGFAKFYEMTAEIPDRVLDWDKAADLDAMTWRQYCKQNFAPGAAFDMFDTLGAMMFGAYPDQISALFVFVKFSQIGLDHIFNSPETGQLSHHALGAQLVSLGLAKDLGDAVKANSPARKVEWSDAGVTVHSDSGVYTATDLIVAIPPNRIEAIEFSPLLPGKRRQFHQRVLMGNFYKAILIYDRPFWRDSGLSGTAMQVGGSSWTSMHDGTGVGVDSVGKLLVFYSGQACFALEGMTEDQRREKITGDVVSAFGNEAGSYLEFYDRLWSDQPFLNGASCPFFAPGAYTLIGDDILTPVGPIHWAGSHYATELPGHMEGAVASAEVVTAEILAKLALGKAA